MTADWAPAASAWWRAKVSAMVCQHLHPGQLQAVDRRADRDRPGADNQPVIAQVPLAALAGDGDLLGGGVDGLGGGVDGLGGVVQQQLEAGLFQVGGGAVG
jgi:hypothetical protein